MSLAHLLNEQYTVNAILFFYSLPSLLKSIKMFATYLITN